MEDQVMISALKLNEPRTEEEIVILSFVLILSKVLGCHLASRDFKFFLAFRLVMT